MMVLKPLACLRFPSSEAGSAVRSLRIIPKYPREGFPAQAARGNHWDWKRCTAAGCALAAQGAAWTCRGFQPQVTPACTWMAPRLVPNWGAHVKPFGGGGGGVTGVGKL